MICHFAPKTHTNNWATGRDMPCRLSDCLAALTRVVAELGHLEVVVGVKVPGQEDKGWQEHVVSKGGMEQRTGAGWGWRGVHVLACTRAQWSTGSAAQPSTGIAAQPSSLLTCSCPVQGRPQRRGPSQSTAAGRRPWRTGRRLRQRRGRAGPEPGRTGGRGGGMAGRFRWVGSCGRWEPSRALMHGR